MSVCFNYRQTGGNNTSGYKIINYSFLLFRYHPKVFNKKHFCILCRANFDFNHWEHKPMNETEKQRILGNGGEIRPPPNYVNSL